LAPFADGLAATGRALSEIRSWPGYAPTPLYELDALAEAVDVGWLHYKDEGQRFGIKSFKPFGGGYAVARILARQVMRETGAATVSSEDLLSDKYDPLLKLLTVACATDGNHGRAVAWAARTFGCQAVVYLASHVSALREDAIRGLGADVVRTDGNHDAAVRQAATDSAREGWSFVSQMATASDLQIPVDIFTGYSALFAECAEQWGVVVGAPTHVFVQCGVGGLAAAGAAYAELRWGEDRPTVVVVEPEDAASVYASVVAGSPQSVTGSLDTVMGGLAAGEVSEAAWVILDTGVDFCVTIPDEAAIDTMRLLAGNDPPVEGGEAGVAGLAAALAVAQDKSAREQLGLDGASRIFTIGTEGATDPELYEQLVGVAPKP
jgi:diaminopropionate ammonia-lyase